MILLAPASLGQDAPRSPSGFLYASPGYVFEFPRDHGAHDEYQTEWWYYTGNLRSRSGKEYGFELTFFRVGVGPPSEPSTSAWDLKHLALAHFAITDMSRRQFRYHEKMNRATPFLAHARSGSLHVFNESWRATTQPDGSMRIVAAAAGDAIDLVLRSSKPPAQHGINGVSVKALGIGHASHYYSMTRLIADGTIRVSDKREEVTGLAWMDHEFGSASLREHQQGWDWFSVQLENETELMLYQIRRTDGSPDVTSSGSIIQPDGNVIHLRAGQFRITPRGSWKSPRSGATYPMGWTIDVLPLNIRLQVRDKLPDQELVTRGSTRVTYWEGAVSVVGSFAGTSVRGHGYVEMTGYDRRFGGP